MTCMSAGRVRTLDTVRVPLDLIVCITAQRVHTMLSF